jgi:hypothetical protein
VTRSFAGVILDRHDKPVDGEPRRAYSHRLAPKGLGGASSSELRSTGDWMLQLLLRGTLPLAVALTVMVTPTYAMTPAPPLQIQIKDECNPATFDAALGSSTACVGNGAVTFSQFLAELMQLQRAPQWHFAPSQRQMTVGQSFTATNDGGEVHTFTEVAQFGGGVVPFLNQLSGMTSVAPECSPPGSSVGPGGLLPFAPQAAASIVPPGASITETEGADDLGHPVLYQCCIHPWMNETITVRS